LRWFNTYESDGTWECSLESVVKPVFVSGFEISSFVDEGQTGTFWLLVLANDIISVKIFFWSDSGLSNSFCFGMFLSMLYYKVIKIKKIQIQIYLYNIILTSSNVCSVMTGLTKNLDIFLA